MISLSFFVLHIGHVVGEQVLVNSLIYAIPQRHSNVKP